MPESEVNPYAAPSAPSEAELDCREIVHALLAPSVGLLLLSLLWGGFSVLAVIVMVVVTVGYFIETGTFAYFGPHRDEVWQVLVMLPSLYTAYGAWCMRRMTAYRTALAASIVACIPFLTPWMVLGIPFGIWAVIVLRRKDVRAAFDAAPNHPH